MIATHSVKLFNAKMKQPAIRAKIINEIPAGAVCSKTVKMSRELWASPVNAALIKKVKQEIEGLPTNYMFSPCLPKIIDGKIKQLLLPIEWRNNQYISITPVPSMGMLHELYSRIYNLKLPFLKWAIQFNPFAYANHGSLLALYKGRVPLLKCDISSVKAHKYKDSFVQVIADLEKANVSSGMVAAGLPAITAIGGAVHALERIVGFDIQFAVGLIKNFTVSKGAILYPAITNNKLCTQISTEEITGNGKIVLLLKSSDNISLIIPELKKLHRLAGGMLFNLQISIKCNEEAPIATYLIDASEAVVNNTFDNADNLDTALEFYKNKQGYILNQSGYAFLEEPLTKNNSRNDNLHAWAEPVYSLITQGAMTSAAWWQRKGSIKSGIFWNKMEK